MQVVAASSALIGLSAVGLYLLRRRQRSRAVAVQEKPRDKAGASKFSGLGPETEFDARDLTEQVEISPCSLSEPVRASAAAGVVAAPRRGKAQDGEGHVYL